MESLRNKVALVTGGGRGLGAEICHMLGYAGAIVLCTDIHRERAAEVAGDLQQAGNRVYPMHLDVTRPDEVQQAVGEVARDFHRLDILVNNASIDISRAVEDIPEADWTRVIDTNLNGPLWLSQAVFPIMKQTGGGQIVNVTATAAKRAWANASAFHASKWGLLGLSHALHVEGRPHNIKVTAVVSGGMRTPATLERCPALDETAVQDPANVAETIRFVLTRPRETVIPEIMVLPMAETTWP